MLENSLEKIFGNTNQFSSSTTGMWYLLDNKYGFKKETQEKLIAKAVTELKKTRIFQLFFKSNHLKKNFQFC